MSRNRRRSLWTTALLLLALSPTALVAANYNEGTNGDLSGNGAAPTSLGFLPVGGHTVTATFGGGDFDIFSFTVGPGAWLDSITLSSYSGSGLSFTGIQAGPVWTAGLGGAVNPSPLLGWTHFGNTQVATNILDDYAGGAGAIGFTPPLLAGTYTIEIQDTGGGVSASMTLNVVPEPSTLLLALLGAVSLVIVSRRRIWR